MQRYCFYRLAIDHDSSQIQKFLKRNSVVSDRYISSTMAYHLVLDRRIKLIHDESNIIKPDYSFLLTCDSGVRDARIRNRLEKKSDVKLENNSGFLDEVQKFLDMDLITLDTSSDSKEQTLEKILGYISKVGGGS
ncbi:MAG: hypothetical protein R3B41_00445 [Candidatus Doudnabacteria bacterium]